RLGHRGELGCPRGNAAEVAFQGLRDANSRGRIATATAKRVEIGLMQNDRSRRDEFLALEPVDFEHGGRGPIQRPDLRLDRVQSAQRAAIVVLVVADQKLFGQPVQVLRLKYQWPDLDRHWIFPS